MEFESDILREISPNELPLLRDYYSNHIPYATHVYSFFNTMLRWTEKQPEKHFFQIFAPDGNWRRDGTFVALLEFSCYDIFLFTMDPKCERLHDALVKTKRLDYKNQMVFFYALHIDHRDAVVDALNKINVPILSEKKAYIYWMPKEEAAELTFYCSEGYYIDTLSQEQVTIINQEWPHRYTNSIKYVSTLIEMNGGRGIFTEEGKLVSWVLKSVIGSLGLLQTLEEYKGKGLGSVITKALSKEIGREGHNPIGTVLTVNEPSKAMFSKSGFQVLDKCVFISSVNHEIRMI